ncbi:hypothetical protein ACYULU_08460 [Breznakiellaceae bacterium SP9]
MKKILLLLFVAAGTAWVQAAPSTFRLVNETGYPIVAVYMNMVNFDWSSSNILPRGRELSDKGSLEVHDPNKGDFGSSRVVFTAIDCDGDTYMVLIDLTASGTNVITFTEKDINKDTDPNVIFYQ